MLDVKEAANIALKYFSDLFKGKYENLALEEAELSDDSKHWNITVGFNVPNSTSFFDVSKTRNFKIFSIDAASGDVLSMKIRNL